ncbi:outer membrane beta-barrel family protein [Pedobacter sp. KR3-3]|uniref:Outer membrane beta-barrel family protein n=1 Tax=Pedobacter albus TaxID=3113905 RepID=A0ABU7IBP7_9SPHI|nr:outer membrane beta-barrel family protein [Pedobacter sp. KR3-3]MEE1946891.1 outer membrane beta-barrel family protein [Pedobacter sp. KR3-3]
MTKSVYLSFFLLFFLSTTLSFAQQKSGSVKGRIIDAKTKKPVDFVSFAVKNVKDSTVAAMGATTTEGNFTAKGLAFGQYKFYAALIGYKPIIKAFEVNAAKPMADFNTIEMEESAITLNDVLIKGELLPMIIKKDTIEFSADAFKTQADANVEDVLKVMPGMEVDKDGNITFNGKKIDRVLVEGKDFFGKDPKTATQNLPKEIVSKIQVIEKKTDDAIFKGIDDGKRENVLNITLKEDKKKGYFGNIVAGKGNSGLYDASTSINRFNGKQQLSIIGLANNINKTSFSYSDLSDFLGGDVFSSGMVSSIMVDAGGNMSVGLNGDDGFGGGGGGINDNKGIGLNYNDEWGKNKKFPNKISFSYMFNRNYGIRQSLTSRLNLLGADSYFNDKNNDATTTSNRHRFTMRLDLALDSTAKIQFTPNFGFSGSDAESNSVFSSYLQNTLANINKGNSTNTSNNKTPGFGGRLAYNKRLSKKGRSFSLSANGNRSDSSVDGLNFSNITINNNGVPTTTILNQLIDQAGDVTGYGFGADYSEPLSKKLSLSGFYNYSKREDVVERMVYDYNTASTRYDLINPGLSRNLENFNESHTTGLRLNYNPTDKLTLGLSADQKFVALKGNNLMNNVNVTNDYNFLQPNFFLSYKINKTSSLSLYGNRYVSTPNISQLQPITDNSNPLQITTGNPNLKPSKQNSVNFSYNRFNPTSGSSISFNGSYYGYEDQIMNNSVLDPKTGIQTTFYDNISGSYSYSGRLSGSIRAKTLGLTFSPSISLNYSHNISFLNNGVVSSNATSYNAGLGINYAIGSDLQLFNRISYNKRDLSYNYNNLPDNSFTSVYNTLSLNAALPYDLRFTLQSNLTYNSNIALGTNNNTIHMANVSFEKLFMKKALSLKATVSDVFNNSRNTSRFANEIYVTESVNLGMRRYFLLGLTYRLRKFGASAVAAPPSVMRF